MEPYVSKNCIYYILYSTSQYIEYNWQVNSVSIRRELAIFELPSLSKFLFTPLISRIAHHGLNSIWFAATNPIFYYASDKLLSKRDAFVGATIVSTLFIFYALESDRDTVNLKISSSLKHTKSVYTVQRHVSTTWIRRKRNKYS